MNAFRSTPFPGVPHNTTVRTKAHQMPLCLRIKIKNRQLCGKVKVCPAIKSYPNGKETSREDAGNCESRREGGTVRASLRTTKSAMHSFHVRLGPHTFSNYIKEPFGGTCLLRDRKKSYCF